MKIVDLKISIKKFLIFSAFCSIFISSYADISVKSFRKLETDLDARVNYPVKDQNGDVCALIKVVTTQTGFTFDGGQLGIVKTVQKPSEIWVYVPYGLSRLSIFHSQLGQLRDYMIPTSVEKACVYELVLVSGQVETTVVDEINSQWLLIKTSPANALIYIDDQFVKSGGEYSAKLKPGKYTYRVEAPLYHTDAGSVEIGDTKKTLNIVLQPAFGYLEINRLPEQGATVMLDGKMLSSVTPLKTDAIASGEHTLQLLKDMYAPLSQKITVTDGQTVPVNLTLQPNFAELQITAPADATLYINNIAKGLGNWQGRLEAGVYTLEARMDKYKTARQDIELAVGDKKTVSLQPTPIYGALDVNSTPAEATITINGKEYGTTPNTINKLLIGDYTVQLSKQGYATANRTVTITEGQTAELNETLSNGREVSISSTPVGAKLFVDNQPVGTTPYSGNLTYGNHTLRIEQGEKRTEKYITIAQTGTNSFSLSFAPPAFDMISVQGGTFQMGNNNGYSREKPIHTITLSDFYIGKTEVTQAQWQTVMGNNPSSFNGDNLPVENVSWNDCQEFIHKLNQMTGNHYRLPTEAEWEYAARGGNQSEGYEYSGSNRLDDVAMANSGSTTYSVRASILGINISREANELGIYDMSGNVWEWCSDWYGSYDSSAQTNPQGAATGSNRVVRGGSWFSLAQHCRVASRDYFTPGTIAGYLGLRLALVP